MKIWIYELCALLAFCSGILTHYATALDNRSWQLCGIVMLCIALTIIFFVDIDQ